MIPIRWQYRVAAALALICMTGAVASLIGAIAVDITRIWVVVLGVVALVLGVWYFLSRRGVMRVVGGALFVVSCAAIVGGLWWSKDSRWLMFMGLADLGLLWLLLRFPLIWLHNDPGVPRGRAESGALLINPLSGDGVAEDVGLEDAARAMGLRVTVLANDDDVVQLAEEAVAAGADALGMAGGDGSLAQVADVACRAGIPFICVPAGTRNHFAQDVGLDRSRVVDTLKAFGPAIELSVDMGRVNGVPFLNNVSLGVYGEVIDEEEYRDAKVATTLSKLPELLGPSAPPLGISFTDVDGETRDDAVVVHVSNNVHNLSPLPGFGQRASLAKGELGIVALRQVQDGAPPRIVSWATRQFTVAGDDKLAGGRDGEAEEYGTPIEFHSEPGVLKVRVPVNMYFHAGSVQINSSTPKRLWRVVRGTF